MNRCVVNVSVGGWYPKGQERLRRSLVDMEFDGDRLFWENEYPPGSPTHEQQPYAFKIAALEFALVRGYDAAVWCDSSVWFIRKPEPIFRAIENGQ